ncbi:MAG: hypothetical protein CMJ18_20445 [Phycisphaeraceae bacterium]|nr:hypothetical protein [Phycisphaeraceae bacterium]
MPAKQTQATQDPIQSRFAPLNVRCTQQRRVVFEALCATRSHPTAEQLHDQLQGGHVALSLATVYNTLEKFCAVGLAHKLPPSGGRRPGGGSSRYDATVHDHLHVRCPRTGEITDVPDRLSREVLDRIGPDLLGRIESEIGMKIEHVHVELVGSRGARSAATSGTRRRPRHRRTRP